MSKCVPGDVVLNVDLDLLMTVIRVEAGEEAVCVWHNQRGRHEAQFPCSALRVAIPYSQDVVLQPGYPGTPITPVPEFDGASGILKG